MKVADFIVNFFEDKGITTLFTIPGGGCIFLNQAFGNSTKIECIVNHHEQGSALAAEGFARTKNDLALCLVTSGPGGSNAWTGTLCSYQDSVPVFFLSGNVNKNLTTNYTGLNLRQLGDQEFDVIKTVSNFTKYAYQINDASEIKYHLEKAYYTAISDRPGPVWLDIPLDVQTTEIDENSLKSYIHDTETLYDQNSLQIILDKLTSCKKPLLIVGHGIKLSKSEKLLEEFLSKYEIPVVTSFNGNDSVSNEYEYYCGRFGTHAQIAANNLIQEADLILSLGSRLYVRQIGYNFDGFAKNAYKIYVDIENNELNKPTLRPDLKINACVSTVLQYLIGNLKKLDNIQNWKEYCQSKYRTTPTVLDRHRTSEKLSVYAVMEKINNFMTADLPVITSDGSANIVGMQVLKLKQNQRLFSNKSTAPMGYGLPASIGSCYANNKKPVLCIEGDGSLHMNIHELQVIKQNNLPIKILLINNDGYLSIKITQKTFCNKLLLSDSSSGLTLPNYKKIIEAYGIQYLSASNLNELDTKLNTFFNELKPIVLEVFVNPNEYHEPKIAAKLIEGKFIPGSLEDIKWIQ